jgi:hypothetical protein
MKSIGIIKYFHLLSLLVNNRWFLFYSFLTAKKETCEVKRLRSNHSVSEKTS